MRFRLTVAVALASCACCGYSAQAWALSEGRVYEMVSPSFKGGYGVEQIAGVLPDGEGVAFKSRGAFAGTPRDFLTSFYLARRNELSWATIPLEPPVAVNNVELSGNHLDLSPTGAVLWQGCPDPNEGSGIAECTERVFVEYDPQTADWRTIGVPVKLLPGVQQTGQSFDIGYEGSSPDFCHVVFTPSGEGPMLVEAKETKAEFYDMTSGCDGEPPALRLVGVNNNGVENKSKVIDPYCQERLGGWGNDTQGKQFNAISANGREIFFTAFVEPADGPTHCGGNIAPSPANPSQLFVRLAGSRTVEVSRPIEPLKPFAGCKKDGVGGEVPCEGASKRAPALFWGASEDGSKVFFTTPAPLTGEKDETDNLYMATIGCPPAEEECEVSQERVVSLVRVSRPAGVVPPAGEAAEVQGVVHVAPDGSHVYFVARGVLSESGPREVRPVQGADNLYAYDSLTQSTAFVAELCSGAGISGSVADARCPGGSDQSLWTQLNEGTEAQVNVCGRAVSSECVGERETGRFLVFSTFAQLIAHGPQVDTDNARDVYRYDMQTGTLDRVSTGENDNDANGNCNDGPGETDCDATVVPKAAEDDGTVYAQQEMLDRAIDEDGSRIVFTTAAPLSLATSPEKHLENVYEWHKEGTQGEGGVSIISTGGSLTSDTQPVITPSGDDIFFVTTQGLVAQDTDGQKDVYDARLAGGFPPVGSEKQECSGEGCYGPLIAPAPLLVPGSVSQEPGGNLAPPVKPKAKAKKSKPRPKAKKRRKAKGGGASRRRVRSHVNIRGRGR